MVREAQLQDTRSLAALALQVWLTTYTKDGMRDDYASFALSHFTADYFEALLMSDDYGVLVCLDDSAIIGFSVVNLVSQFQGKPYGFEVEKLYVHNNFQGRGIGKQLLDAISQRWGRKFWLYTWVENDSNHFYQRLGFKLVGELTFDFSGVVIHNNVYISPAL
ncbi:GCN5 family acetyltransferase [Pseudoalteromonas luteoviolacea]|nr:GCN5 family acetyltransferase [Pseudoalteromonas luteoviolacea]AOT15176.1 GCN5 family acetyltransferase [Pseudoalteromonas luteoviolacea]AOT20092.1 GCN5 family acetyltransferase [Pseudoalteromonas luteoviolacea]